MRGHNKRGCPQREGVGSSTSKSALTPTTSTRAGSTGSGKEKGKPKVIFEFFLVFLTL